MRHGLKAPVLESAANTGHYLGLTGLQSTTPACRRGALSPNPPSCPGSTCGWASLIEHARKGTLSPCKEAILHGSDDKLG